MNIPRATNHQQCVRDALTPAENLCAERGVQLTAIRHQALESIWASYKAVKTYQLPAASSPYNARQNRRPSTAPWAF